MKKWKIGGVIGGILGFLFTPMLILLGARDFDIYLLLTQFTIVGSIIGTIVGYWVSWIEPKAWKIGTTIGAILGVITDYYSIYCTNPLRKTIQTCPWPFSELSSAGFFYLVSVIVTFMLFSAGIGFLIDKYKSKK